MTKEKLKSLVVKCSSKKELHKYLGIPYNGTGTRQVNAMLAEHGLTLKRVYDVKHPEVEKTCPVCQSTFKTKQGHSREKATCSYACANTHFRTGINNPNWKQGGSSLSNQSTCFHFHEKKCVICDESNIVAVHHYDENHKNANPDNLIPLCPTHHHYYHSKFRYLVEDKINNYRDSWIKKNANVS